MTLKKLYHLDKSDINLNQIRINQGFREIYTLKYLINYFYNKKVEGKLLDLGCGDKHLAPSCLNSNIDYIGIDYDSIDFETEELPFDSNSIDIVVSLAVIEHLNNPGLFISEIFRCLKPNGIVYLSTPNFKLDYKNFYNDPTHVKPYTNISLETLLKLYNFESVITTPGVRCKDISWYKGKFRFWKAYYLLPFTNDFIWAPKFLKGHSRSIFAFGKKTNQNNY